VIKLSKNQNSKKRAIVFCAFGLSGAAALIYEVLWARTLSLVFGNTVYAVSTMLTAFMAGLSLGAFIGGKLTDKTNNHLFLFGVFELGIALFGLATFPLIKILPSIYIYAYKNLNLSFYSFCLIQFILSFLIMVIPTSLMGATFPVVSKIVTNKLTSLGEDIGNIYSVNTFGSIAGSFLAGFVLIPIMGITKTAIIAALLNLIAASSVLFLSKSKHLFKILGGGIMFFLLLSISIAASSPKPVLNNFYTLSEQNLDKYLKTIFNEENVNGIVYVFYNSINGERSLQVDGKFEGSTGPQDMSTQLMLAHLPILSHPNPKNFLNIGLGTGYTVKTALEYPLKQICCVEINPAVVRAARQCFNENIFLDPRLNLVIADARNYLTVEEKKYDIISSEPSYPTVSSVSNLFTLEFYKIVESRLSENGIFCQWIPYYLLQDKDVVFMLKTFNTVFNHTYIWKTAQWKDYKGGDLLFIGSKTPFKYTAEQIEQRVRARIDYPFYLSKTPEQVREITKGNDIPLNTDDKPMLEFTTPRNYITGLSHMRSMYR